MPAKEDIGVWVGCRVAALDMGGMHGRKCMGIAGAARGPRRRKYASAWSRPGGAGESDDLEAIGGKECGRCAEQLLETGESASKDK
eukprot:gene2841-17743_t